ncbi:MAG: hypothetical protein AB7O97_08475 [Planctomycetota bacterium]
MATLFALAVTQLASAQTAMPRGLDALDGNRQGIVFENSLRVRYLMVFDRSEFPLGDGPWAGPGPWLLQGLRLRRDGSLQGSMDSHQKTVRVILSTGGSTPAAPSATFESNHGSDRTVVYGGPTTGTSRSWNGSARIANQYQTPSLTNFDWGSVPALPFEQVIQFATPFTVPVAATSLVIDITVYDTTDPQTLGRTWTADADDQGKVEGGMHVVGAPCAPAGAMERGGTGGIRIGSTLETWVGVGPNGSVPEFTPVIAALGVPQDPALVVGGFPCPIHFTPMVYAVTSTDFDGRAIVLWGQFPVDPFLVGQELGLQYAAAPQGLLWMSPSFQFRIGAPPQPTAPRRYASVVGSGDLSWDPDAPAATGTPGSEVIVVQPF